MNPLALTVGYTHNGNGYDARIFQSSGEDVFRVSADAVGSSWATFRVQYEVGSRSGSGLDEKALIDIGEQPEMRHYDLADRTRNRFTGQVDFVPSDVWMFSVSGGILHDDYGDTFFGLQESTGRTFSLAADYHQPNGLGAGATYNLERYSRTAAVARRGFVGRAVQRSAAQLDGPIRPRRVHYFSIYATPPRIGRNTEVRFSYDFSHASGSYLYTIPAGSPIPTPNQLPDVFNKLQQLHIDARYRVNERTWRRRSRTSTSHFACMTSRSIPASSTASSSPVRWSWDTSIVRTPRMPFVVRREISLVINVTHFSGGSMSVTHTMKRVLARERADARPLQAASFAAAGQDAAQIKKGEGVYTAQKCSLCHAIAGKGQQGQSARRCRHEVDRRRHPAVDHASDRGGREGQVDQEAADAGEVRQPAGRRSRRARRLHGEPEVERNMAGREALIRHPLAIAGAVITTASAVVFIALVDRECSRACSQNPYAGPRRLRRHPCRVSWSGLRAHPDRHAAAAAKAAGAIPTRSPTGRSSTSGTPSVRRTALLIVGADRGQHRHRAAGRLRRRRTGWNRRRSADRPATRRCIRSSRRGSRRSHARVACASCHIGEGASGFVHAKLSGVRQLVHVATELLSEADPAWRRHAAGRPGDRPASAATSRDARPAITSA